MSNLTRTKSNAMRHKKVYGHRLENIWKLSKNIERGKGELWYIARDIDGKTISFWDYGKTWQVDHIIPQNENGSNILSNLQPLNSKSNNAKRAKIDWTSRKNCETFEKEKNNTTNRCRLKSPRLKINQHCWLHHPANNHRRHVIILNIEKGNITYKSDGYPDKYNEVICYHPSYFEKMF